MLNILPQSAQMRKVLPPPHTVPVVMATHTVLGVLIMATHTVPGVIHGNTYSAQC